MSIKIRHQIVDVCLIQVVTGGNREFIQIGEFEGEPAHRGWRLGARKEPLAESYRRVVAQIHAVLVAAEKGIPVTTSKKATQKR